MLRWRRDNRQQERWYHVLLSEQRGRVQLPQVQGQMIVSQSLVRCNTAAAPVTANTAPRTAAGHLHRWYSFLVSFFMICNLSNFEDVNWSDLCSMLYTCSLPIPKSYSLQDSTSCTKYESALIRVITVLWEGCLVLVRQLVLMNCTDNADNMGTAAGQYNQV